MKTSVEKQITNEIMEKISQINNIEDFDSRVDFAEVIVRELNVQNFTPYVAYGNDEDIFIGLKYDYSDTSIEDDIITFNHDAAIDSNGVYIDDELDLQDLKKNGLTIIKENQKAQEIQKELELLNNELSDIENFELPKYAGYIHSENLVNKKRELEEHAIYLKNKISKLEKEKKDY